MHIQIHKQGKERTESAEQKVKKIKKARQIAKRKKCDNKINTCNCSNNNINKKTFVCFFFFFFNPFKKKKEEEEISFCDWLRKGEKTSFSKRIPNKDNFQNIAYLHLLLFLTETKFKKATRKFRDIYNNNNHKNKQTCCHLLHQLSNVC